MECATMIDCYLGETVKLGPRAESDEEAIDRDLWSAQLIQTSIL